MRPDMDGLRASTHCTHITLIRMHEIVFIRTTCAAFFAALFFLAHGLFPALAPRLRLLGPVGLTPMPAARAEQDYTSGVTDAERTQWGHRYQTVQVCCDPSMLENTNQYSFFF
jgi:hypothetical protein